MVEDVAASSRHGGRNWILRAGIQNFKYRAERATGDGKAFSLSELTHAQRHSSPSVAVAPKPANQRHQLVIKCYNTCA